MTTPARPRAGGRAPEKEYSGTVSADLDSDTEADATLAVDDNGDWRAVTLVRENTSNSSGGERRLYAATAGSGSAWIALGGTSSVSGDTVRLLVVNADRTALSSSGGVHTSSVLSSYADCSITARIGNDFHQEALNDILQCLAENGEQVPTTGTVTVASSNPADLIVGTWRPLSFDGMGDSDDPYNLLAERRWRFSESGFAIVEKGRSAQYSSVNDSPPQLVYEYYFTRTWTMSADVSDIALTNVRIVEIERCNPDTAPPGYPPDQEFRPGCSKWAQEYIDSGNAQLEDAGGLVIHYVVQANTMSMAYASLGSDAVLTQVHVEFERVSLP